MKIFILVSIIFAVLLVHPPLFAQLQANSAEVSREGSRRQFLLADVTGFPFNHTHSGSWKPYQSIRVGYGREIHDRVEIRFCADYSWFDFDNSPGGLSGADYSRGKRRDISLYPAIVLFKFAEIALGCTHTTQDEVVHVVGLEGDTNPPQKQTTDPAVKEFGVYFHFGLGGSLHIAGPVSIPLGILFRTDVPKGINFGCRAGLQYEM